MADFYSATQQHCAAAPLAYFLTAVHSQVAADSAAELAKAIEAMACQPAASLAELGARGRAWVATHRTWDHTVDALEACYRGLTAPLPR